MTKEQEIISGCLKGERKAQEKLYGIFFNETYRLCRRYTQSDALAADALNIGFLKVFNHIDDFNPAKGDLGAWIRTILIRTCINLQQSELRFRKRNSRGADLRDDWLQPDIIEKLYAADLLEMIRSLPPATRLVFNLYEVDGYSHREIAELTGSQESTSRWHLAEAKRQLREAIQKGESNP
jgi:RNA polymerase sigma-70 factor (ECF subfamily)